MTITHYQQAVDQVPAGLPGTWSSDLPSFLYLSNQIAKTEFVPTALRGRPEAVLACFLSGQELGIGPMQALSKIHIIDGRPAQAAELMRALVLRAGHEIWTEEISNTRCVMVGRRQQETHSSKVTWTLDDAKKAGLLNRNSWQKYPRAMLIARATGELCRLIFADVLGGISYTVEELTDGDVVDVADLSASTSDNGAAAEAKPTTRRRRARSTAAPAEAPAPAESPEPAETTQTPPLPGTADPEDLVPEHLRPGRAVETMPNDQLIAMRAREAGIDDHHRVVQAATDGRHNSAKLDDADDVARVLEAISQLNDGTHLLERASSPDGLWRIREKDEQDEPITDEQRAALLDTVGKLTAEQKKQLNTLTGGRVVPPASASFSLRHLELVADTIEQILDEAEKPSGTDPFA